MRRLGSLALLSTTLAVGCEESENDKGSSIPPGCEDLFAQGDFECTEPEVCTHLEENPDRVARWRATLEPGNDHEREFECIETYLKNEGIDEAASFYVDSVAVDATYPQIEPLCRAAMVDTCSATAASEQCNPLDERACTDEPMCNACTGYKLDPEQACFVQNVFAVCGDQDESPQGLTGPYVGPDGSCWSGQCLHSQPGWTADPEAAFCPYLGGSDAPPICAG
jgi:hypothetical protein